MTKCYLKGLSKCWATPTPGCTDLDRTPLSLFLSFLSLSFLPLSSIPPSIYLSFFLCIFLSFGRRHASSLLWCLSHLPCSFQAGRCSLSYTLLNLEPENLNQYTSVELGFFFFKILSILEREHYGGGADFALCHWAQSLTWGYIPWPWDDELSQNQALDA